MKKYLSVILLLSVWLVSGCGKKSKVMIDYTDGYKGAAKMNPYLAAQTFLRETHDAKVKVKNGFVKFRIKWFAFGVDDMAVILLQQGQQ